MAAGEFTVDLTGDKHLQAALGRLAAKVEKRVLGKATTSAMAPIRKAMRGLAPVQHGFLKKALAVKKKYYRRSGLTLGFVGAKTRFSVTMTTVGGQRRLKPAAYAHLVEGGTAPHTIRRRRFGGITNTAAGLYLRELKRYATVVHHLGTRPTRFMGKAWTATQRLSLQEFTKRCWKEIRIEAEKERVKGRA